MLRFLSIILYVATFSNGISIFSCRKLKSEKRATIYSFLYVEINTGVISYVLYVCDGCIIIGHPVCNFDMYRLMCPATVRDI